MASTTISPLTDRQAEVLEIIRESLTDRGYPPTIREISRRLGVHISATVGHLEALAKKGYIERDEGVTRGIRILRYT